MTRIAGDQADALPDGPRLRGAAGAERAAEKEAGDRIDRAEGPVRRENNIEWARA